MYNYTSFVGVMMKDIFLERYPKIDLHGYDRDSARVAVNDFIDENIILGNDTILIIHGIGTGIIKKEVHLVPLIHIYLYNISSFLFLQLNIYYVNKSL